MLTNYLKKSVKLSRFVEGAVVYSMVIKMFDCKLRQTISSIIGLVMLHGDCEDQILEMRYDYINETIIYVSTKYESQGL